MNKKLLWFIAFGVVAAISCWATSSSFHLMMPSMPLWAVWSMTIVFFVLASYAVKLIMDAVRNDGYLDHPRAQFWGGVGLLLLTWIIVSLPTNAHTFFYKLKIGDVVTGDLKTTKYYSQQLADRTNTDSAYFEIEKKVMEELGEFQREVTGAGKASNYQRGVRQHAIDRIVRLNNILTPEYAVPTPAPMSGGNSQQLAYVSNAYGEMVKAKLDQLRKDKYQAPDDAVKSAKKDIKNITAMEDSIHQLILTQMISDSKAEPLIKEAEGVLVVAYSNIKNNKNYVVFDSDAKDSKLYTADPLETKTTRFLNPYSVASDFFSGKIPFSFIFWLILSILIDVSGFIFFYLATKKEFSF